MKSNILEIELAESLRKKYNVKNEIYLGAGWLALLVGFFKEFEDLEISDKIHFDQIKEKFGQLRIYYDYPELDLSKLDALVQKYEDLASKTCYFCGQPGTVDTIKFWVNVRCSKCFEERKEKIV